MLEQISLNRYGTKFLESEAMLAAQENDDEEYLSVILSKLNQGELARLMKASDLLYRLCREERRSRDDG